MSYCRFNAKRCCFVIIWVDIWQILINVVKCWAISWSCLLCYFPAGSKAKDVVFVKTLSPVLKQILFHSLWHDVLGESISVLPSCQGISVSTIAEIDLILRKTQLFYLLGLCIALSFSSSKIMFCSKEIYNLSEMLGFLVAFVDKKFSKASNWHRCSNPINFQWNLGS